MPTPELAKALSDLGGWTLLVFVAIALVVGAFRRWVVLGWIYVEERTARLAAETQAARNADSLEQQTKAYAQLATDYSELTKSYAKLAEEARRDRRRRGVSSSEG